MTIRIIDGKNDDLTRIQCVNFEHKGKLCNLILKEIRVRLEKRDDFLTTCKAKAAN